MNWLALLGIILLVYAFAVALIATQRPEKIWNMAKIRMFIKVMGEKGTRVFFYVFAFLAAAAGLFLLIRYQ